MGHGSVPRTFIGGVLIAVVVLAGCGSPTPSPSTAVPSATTPNTSAPSSQPATAAPSVALTSPTAAASGPATAHFVATGDASVAGPLKITAVRCFEPSLAGEQIVVDTQAADPAVLIRFTLTDGNVFVKVAAGASTTYTERDFTGTGVTGFDAAKGAQIDGPLVSQPSTAPGKLGTMTSVTGSVDCAGQQAGTTTLTLSGETGSGAFAGVPDPVRVECVHAQPDRVGLVGVGMVGTDKALIIISISAGQVTVFDAPASPPDHFFVAKGTAIATVTSTGAHVDLDLPEQVQSGAVAHTIHLSGDATCGSST
jgi:hypothetical protein